MVDGCAGLMTVALIEVRDRQERCNLRMNEVLWS